jgi:hypothetical protein
MCPALLDFFQAISVTKVERAIDVHLSLPSIILCSRHIAKNMHCRNAHKPDAILKLIATAYWLRCIEHFLLIVVLANAMLQAEILR